MMGRPVDAASLDPPAVKADVNASGICDCAESGVNGTGGCALSSDVVGTASRHEVFPSCTAGGT
jgi:hypothetical protein